MLPPLTALTPSEVHRQRLPWQPGSAWALKHAQSRPALTHLQHGWWVGERRAQSQWLLLKLLPQQQLLLALLLLLAPLQLALLQQWGLQPPPLLQQLPRLRQRP